MRISDWSSDVCSSDLIGHGKQQKKRCEARHDVDDAAIVIDTTGMQAVVQHPYAQEHGARHKTVRNHLDNGAFHSGRVEYEETQRHKAHVRNRGRSEEHTSELQSLMRISYAVFCLKKKTHAKTM